MARYVMVLRRATLQHPLRRALEGGGPWKSRLFWSLEIETFLGPEMATSEAGAVWARVP
jgi:hypothetical protein